MTKRDNKDSAEYKMTNKKINAVINKVKENWINEQCQKITDRNSKHDNRYKLKEITGNKKKIIAYITRDNRQKIQLGK